MLLASSMNYFRKSYFAGGTRKGRIDICLCACCPTVDQCRKSGSAGKCLSADKEQEQESDGDSFRTFGRIII